MRITLYADYADYVPWPIWGPRGLLSDDELPLSDALKDRVRAWLNAYYSSPRPDWPIWHPPEGKPDEEEPWIAEGAAIRDLMAAELGPRYAVEFES